VSYCLAWSRLRRRRWDEMIYLAQYERLEAMIWKVALALYSCFMVRGAAFGQVAEQALMGLLLRRSAGSGCCWPLGWDGMG